MGKSSINQSQMECIANAMLTQWKHLGVEDESVQDTRLLSAMASSEILSGLFI